MMMRQPEQRLISALHHKRLNHKKLSVAKLLPRLIRKQSGCAVKMLTRSPSGAVPFGSCAQGEPPTAEEVSEAIHRLQTGFAFVGLTDRWEWSMCLWDAKYGNACNDFNFVNVRPGQNETKTYDTSELGNFTDTWDGPLYKAAKTFFMEEIKKYGVTDASCQACLQKARMERALISSLGEVTN